MASSGGVGVAPKAGRVGAAPKPLIPRSAFGIAGVQSPLPGAPPVSTATPQGPPPIPRSALGLRGSLPPGGISHSGIPGAQPGAAPPKATPQQNQGASSQDQSSGNPFLDPTYYSNTATNLFNTNNKIAGLGQQITDNNIALQSALGTLAEQEPINQLKQMYAANRSGGLYGSVEAGDQGLLARNYQEQQSGLQTATGNKNDALSQEITNLQSGIPLYNNAQEIASTNRVVAQLAKNPALAALLGINVPGTTAPGSAAGGSSAPATAPAGTAPGGPVHGNPVAPIPRSAFGLAGPQTALPNAPKVSGRPARGLPPVPRSALGIAGGMFRGGKGKGSSGGAGY